MSRVIEVLANNLTMNRVMTVNNPSHDSIYLSLLQDSWYDRYRGTVNLVQVFDGVLKLGEYGLQSVQMRILFNLDLNSRYKSLSQ